MFSRLTELCLRGQVRWQCSSLVRGMSTKASLGIPRAARHPRAPGHTGSVVLLAFAGGFSCGASALYVANEYKVWSAKQELSRRHTQKVAAGDRSVLPEEPLYVRIGQFVRSRFPSPTPPCSSPSSTTPFPSSSSSSSSNSSLPTTAVPSASPAEILQQSSTKSREREQEKESRKSGKSKSERLLKVANPAAPLVAWCTITALTALLAAWRVRNAYHARQFFGRINITVSSIQNGYLTSRTLLERTIEEVFYNKYASRLVMKAARDATAEHPFLLLSPREGPIIHSMAFSQVSSVSSYGYLRAASGLPVTRDWYVFGITCEKDHSILLKKIRILLVKEELLKKIATMDTPPFESFRRPQEAEIRWKTLKEMTRLYQEQLEHTDVSFAGSSAQLTRIELVLPGVPSLNNQKVG